jgi:hypothetical protein
VSEKTVYAKQIAGDTWATTSTTTASQKTLLVATGAAASSGDNTLISAPGALLKIVIVGFIIQNETAVATLMRLLNDTGGTAFARCLGQNQGDGLTMNYPDDARYKLALNKPLVLNLGGANSCGYTVWYYTEA